MKYLMFLCFGLIGCYTAKKAGKDVDKAQRNHPAVVAGRCAELYPCVINKVDSVVLVDTFVTVECPDSTVVTEVITKNDTIIQVKTKTIKVNVPAKVQTVYITKEIESTAKLSECEERAKLTQSVLTKSVNRERKWKNIYLGSSIALLIIGLIMGWLLKRK